MSRVAPARQPRTAFRFVVALGIVSLFADATYEGARSVLGPYLATLGAGAAAVGVVAGAGELAGYLLRLAAGYLADRLRRPWLLIGAGYAVNQVSVPLLALAGTWPVAAALVIAERAGKAIRTPARDAVLAAASQPVGRGRAFGIHEALDQVGAVAGPLAVAGFVAWLGGYRVALALLAVPAVLCLASLASARRLEPAPPPHADPPPDDGAPSAPLITPAFRWYLAGAALLGLGFADFPLLAFHIERADLAAAAAIPALYAFAMGIDAAAALAAGEWFDRAGTATTALAGVLAAGAPALVFLGGTAAAVAGVALWGAAMGVQESTLRAGVAHAAPAERRATAYGLFHAVFGVAWFAGSAAMGALYGAAPGAAAAFAAAACAGGAVLLAAAGRLTR